MEEEKNEYWASHSVLTTPNQHTFPLTLVTESRFCGELPLFLWVQSCYTISQEALTKPRNALMTQWDSWFNFQGMKLPLGDPRWKITGVALFLILEPWRNGPFSPACWVLGTTCSSDQSKVWCCRSSFNSVSCSICFKFIPLIFYLNYPKVHFCCWQIFLWYAMYHITHIFVSLTRQTLHSRVHICVPAPRINTVPLGSL